MAWTISYNQDTDIKNTGTLRAIYTDTFGEVTTVYERRTNTDDADDLTKFVDEAHALEAKLGKIKQDNTAILDKVTLLLNTKK